MPDHKFERQYDRRGTLHDEKHRILDMLANPFEVPDVAWDEQPVRYFKLNLQWCKILAGWLDWMEEVAGWRDAEGDDHPGIQGFLEFEVGINGGVFMTPEEYYDAHKRATYDAWNDIAKQIVSGRTTNIAVGGDGTVTDPTTGGEGGEGVPPDDPTTPEIREDLESRAGGAIFLTNKLDKILLDMFTWFSGYVAPSTGVTSQMAEDRLVNLYEFEPANANNLASYWYDVYQNASGAVDLNDSVLDGLFYCKGVSLTTFARYIYEHHSTAAELPVLEIFLESLTQAQLDNWFAEGTAVPSKAYETYSCTLIDPEQVTLNMSTAEIVQVATAGVWKQNHRFRCIISGSFTDSDTPDIVRDFFWEHNTATGVKTFRNSNPFISGATSGAHNAAEVPFEASHNYNVIVEKTGATGACIVSCDNAPFNLPNTVGSITVDIEDLGEFAS